MLGGRVHETNLTEGNLAKNIILFALPIMLTSILQLLYNAADVIVVGRYAGSASLAAVSSNASLINLVITLFVSFSIGVDVNTSKYFGAHNERGVSDMVHTSMLFAPICGIAVGIFGFFAAKDLLIMMSSPYDVIDLATTYLKIYFIGVPGVVVYNFGAALLRSAGDTQKPLIFLSISGVLNVILNLVFVIVFKMGVAGVALATTISQYVSTSLIIICLMKTDTALKLIPSRLRFKKRPLLNIIKVGLPAGIQGMLFSISNVLVQSTVNTFGSVVMAGNGAAISIESFCYFRMDAFCQASVTATGQSMGAKKYGKLGRILRLCLLYVTAMGILWGIVFIFFGAALGGIYSPGKPEVIEITKMRLLIFGYTYFILGIMNVFMGMLRGIGYSTAPTLISIIGICGFRVVWIYAIFPLQPTLSNLYISYPVSWVLTLAIVSICYFALKKRMLNKKILREPPLN